MNEQTKTAMSADEIRAQLQTKGVKTTVRTFAPGIDIEVQSVDLATYLACGLLPEHFHRTLVEASKKTMDGREIDQRLDQMSTEEIQAMTLLRPRFVMAACVRPKVVPGPAQQSDEISLLELPEETQQSIFDWVLAGCPGIAIRMGGREVKVEDLDRFRQGGQKKTGGQPFSLEPGGEPVRETSERVAQV